MEERELREARVRESRQKELIEDRMAELEKAVETASEFHRKQYERDLDEYRLRLVDMSKAVEEKQAEIEALKARKHSLDEREKSYLTEINAQKVFISEIKAQHEKEIEKLSFEINRSWQPEIAVLKLEHIAEMIRSTISYIADQNYPAEIFSDFQRGMVKISEAYADLVKRIDNHN